MSNVKKRNTTVDIIGTVGVPASYGGFETLVENLIRHLNNQFQITVYCSGPRYKHKTKKYQSVELRYVPLEANGVMSIFYDAVSMFWSVKKGTDILLVLGVSGAVVFPFIKLFRKVIVVNIDGLEWKREKWNRFASRFLKLSERIAVRYADVVITDNHVIREYVASEYGKESICIAYGGDQYKDITINDEHGIAVKYGNRYALKICRIEPENNVEIVLDAFACKPEHNLVVVGNWDSSDFGRSLRQRFSSNENLFLLDPIYDSSKLTALRNGAYLYVHGHSAGGTNPSLVEAMSHGLPVLAFDCGYNRSTTENEAGYFSSKTELSNFLGSSDSNSLERNGIKMFEIAGRRYSWKIICTQYSDILSGAG